MAATYRGIKSMMRSVKMQKQNRTFVRAPRRQNNALVKKIIDNFWLPDDGKAKK